MKKKKSEVEDLQAAFQSGNLGALHEILYLCGKNRQPLPDWAGRALLEILRGYMKTKKVAATGRCSTWMARYRQDMEDYVRWDTVRMCRDSYGLPWDIKADNNVYETASVMLRGDFGQGSADAIRGSYRRVLTRSKKDAFRYMLFSSLRPPDNYRPSRDQHKEVRMLMETPRKRGKKLR